MKYYTRNEQKEIAASLLKMLRRSETEIACFSGNNDVLLSFTDYDGITTKHKVKDKPEVAGKLEEVERHFNSVVYAVIGTPTAWGYNYSFLMTSRYREDQELIYLSGNCRYVVWSYVWNIDAEYCSEPGKIGIFSVPNYPIIRIS